MSYAIVNSRATDGIAPGTKISYRISPWKIWLYSADAAVAILAIGMTVVMICRTKHAKANPDLYKPRKLRSKKKEDAQPKEA
ncbi:peptidase [Bifidobacterium dentium]|uniref:peptidase n=1 Tax=Bifidobacterium dentium TaxID=1689 RepID=UPI0026DDA40A|nr:peptidase [Bifidobacterium dentium]